ncbi:disulfide bond formation protein B [Parendozoicomonas sp. Alg238-R29]|uniref:disulfide bond formation protein B n=1 Tax=Parendozoicomonas sp. Alg238-R29 TaxID=2993446 RepID=UPI00248E8351|nr:disulfide bond formation protein B [Parendozoicomonas sp. Alg238-R29]
MVADRSSFTQLWQSLLSSPLRTLHGWQQKRLTWLIMLATTLFLEGCALFFQYVMLLDPCELCVYQRLAIGLLGVVSLIMLIAPSNIFIRLSGYSLWVVSGLYGLQKAMIQTGSYETFNTINQSCNFYPTFPFELPLYEWLPSLFMPTGFCGSDDWALLGLNMAEWMVIVFGIYLLAAAVCIFSSAWCWIRTEKR